MNLTLKITSFTMNVLSHLWLQVHTYYQSRFYKAPVAIPDPYARSRTPRIDNSQVGIVKDVFAAIIDTPLYQTLQNEVIYSKRCNIPTIGSAAHRKIIRRIPSVMQSPFETIETRDASRLSYTVWVLWMTDRSVNIVTPKQNCGRVLMGDDIFQINDAPDVMPENVDRAVRVIIGTELVNNTLRGVRWEHYLNRNHY